MLPRHLLAHILPHTQHRIQFRAVNGQENQPDVLGGVKRPGGADATSPTASAIQAKHRMLAYS